MITIGKYIGTITENNLGATMSGKPYVSILFDIEGDLMDCKIWLVPKTIKSGMAQKQLAKCGFDYDRNELAELGENHNLLNGVRVPITVSENEYNGNTSLQCNIDLGNVEKSQIEKLQESLRAKKVTKENPDAGISDEDIPF